MEAVPLLAAVASIVVACRVLGVCRASWYRQLEPRPVIRERKPPARALTLTERQQVLDAVHSRRFVDQAPAQIYASLLDQGTYLCSTRTMYRILASARENRERRDLLRHPRYEPPQLLATGPNQLWSWDITKLLGPVKWVYFYLYVLLDVFSRYAVGWMLAHRDSAALAKRLIEESCLKQGIEPGQLTVHSDRGPAMTSSTLAQLFARLGVTKTHSRPHVSNDNPFSEAQFKTLKYRPDFPDRFGSIEHGLSHCRDFFAWYNDEHHHSALGWLTPADVHYARAPKVLEKRSQVLSAAYHLRPERFVHGCPQPASPPLAVWINPPISKTTRQLAPGTTIVTPDDVQHPPVFITYGDPAGLPPDVTMEVEH